MTDESSPLAARWAALLPDATHLGDNLIERYSEPTRRYHHGGHLLAVLEGVDLLADEADDIHAVRLAAWFHDAVYDVRAKANEEQSARLAVEELEVLELEFDLVEEVARLVRLTESHRAEPDDRNGHVLCDADLAILAAEPAAYDAYAREIRAEYGHVSDADFRRGRTAVLEQLLGLPDLFGTELGRTAWEPRARANLERELASLAAG